MKNIKAENKKGRPIDDGVGCPADNQSEKTIFRPQQKGDIEVVKDDGTKEKQRVIPPHSTNHSRVTPGGIPVIGKDDEICDQDGFILGPIIHKEPENSEPETCDLPQGVMTV